jgi:hypothetical protein
MKSWLSLLIAVGVLGTCVGCGNGVGENPVAAPKKFNKDSLIPKPGESDIQAKKRALGNAFHPPPPPAPQ